jgi:hypothetical protein
VGRALTFNGHPRTRWWLQENRDSFIFDGDDDDGERGDAQDDEEEPEDTAVRGGGLYTAVESS